MKTLATLMLVLLTGCASTFEARPRVPSTVVEWHLVDDPDRYCRDLGAESKSGQRIMACAQIYPDLHRCRIYTARQTEMELLGHELRHCFEGLWHE